MAIAPVPIAVDDPPMACAPVPQDRSLPTSSQEMGAALAPAVKPMAIAPAETVAAQRSFLLN